MKSRLGYVSNSSSSSFVLAWDGDGGAVLTGDGGASLAVSADRLARMLRMTGEWGMMEAEGREAVKAEIMSVFGDCGARHSMLDFADRHGGSLACCTVEYGFFHRYLDVLRELGLIEAASPDFDFPPVPRRRPDPAAGEQMRIRDKSGYGYVIHADDFDRTACLKSGGVSLELSAGDVIGVCRRLSGASFRCADSPRGELAGGDDAFGRRLAEFEASHKEADSFLAVLIREDCFFLADLLLAARDLGLIDVCTDDESFFPEGGAK